MYSDLQKGNFQQMDAVNSLITFDVLNAWKSLCLNDTAVSLLKYKFHFPKQKYTNQKICIQRGTAWNVRAHSMKDKLQFPLLAFDYVFQHWKMHRKSAG